MLSVQEARKIGIRACIDKIGYDFCKNHADNAVSAYGKENGAVECFVGVSDSPAPECDINNVTELILTSASKWPYYARCMVNLKTEKVVFVNYKTPSGEHKDVNSNINIE